MIYYRYTNQEGDITMTKQLRFNYEEIKELLTGAEYPVVVEARFEMTYDNGDYEADTLVSELFRPDYTRKVYEQIRELVEKYSRPIERDEVRIVLGVIRNDIYDDVRVSE